MLGLKFLILFWQGVPITSKPTPEPTDSSAYFLVLFASILSFIFGVLVTTIFFVSKRAVSNSNQSPANISSQIDSPRINIKQCPKCSSTYTDEDLTYCLRDGLALKVVGSMPIPIDADKTIAFKN